MKFAGVAVDVDGTLTDESGQVDFRAIEALRRLERAGVRVVLASGNSYPVLMGLANYLVGCLVVAENGGVVGRYSEYVLLGDPSVGREARDAILRELGGMVVESWQNRFRLVDFAFYVRRGLDPLEVKAEVEDLLEGVPAVVEYSGWAIHVRDERVDKGRGLEAAAEMLSLRPGDFVAVGDSETDLSMLERAGLGIALANSPAVVKERASLITKRAGPEGVLEALEMAFAL